MLLLGLYSTGSRHTHAHTSQPRVQAICTVNGTERVELLLSLHSAAKPRRWQVAGDGESGAGFQMKHP